MPTYEYECPEGHRFERFQKMSEAPRAECPTCGAQARRLLSGGAGFLFKGEGFYATDYRSEDYRKQASKESSDGAVEGASSKKSPSGETGSGKAASPGSSDGKEPAGGSSKGSGAAGDATGKDD
mgnify:CR=1 FL=1